MRIMPNHESVRLTGRWHLDAAGTVTTATGGTIEIAVCGEFIELFFNTDMNMEPVPHIWIGIDGGPRVESVVQRVLRVEFSDAGPHLIRVIYKGAVESQHRWYPPLIGKLHFIGYEAGSPALLPPDGRPIIEFIGDSITEGQQIDAEHEFSPILADNYTFQNDAAASYGWQTAKLLGMCPRLIGYGCLGATHGGRGGVPIASEAYPYNFSGSPVSSFDASVIVVNLGANDRNRSEEEYIREYRSLLAVIRQHNPAAKLVVLSAFCVVYPAALRAMVDAVNRETGDSIVFLDSAGWVPPEPLHPGRDAHRHIAEKLAAALRPLL
ncbi:MAG: hypothetical protein IKL84_02535 [Clostridia bacterium]|nr:hypothetical protein [Clostridia bacterium]